MSKSASPKQPVPTTPTTSDTMRIVKVDECPSLSGASTIQFHIGVDSKNGDGHIRISGNTGAGIYTPIWIAVKSVHDEFAHVGNRALASREFLPGLRGKSSNNFGFVTAALFHIGVIARAPEEGKYVRADGKQFMAEMQKLIEAGVNIEVSLPEKTAKKLPESKPTKAASKKSEKSVQAASSATPCISSDIVLPGSLEPA